MNTPSRILVSLSVLLASAVGLAQPAGAAAAATRYASPGGSGTACSSSHPCSVVTAINNAHHKGEVVLRPGEYGSKEHPIATSLVAHATLNIHGVAGKSRPFIHSSADTGMDLGASTVRYIRIDSSGSNSAIFSLGGVVTHTVAVSTAVAGTACAVFATLIDSVCVATGVEGVAVSIQSGSGGPSTDTIKVAMRNVTAEAIDPTGIGLVVSAGAHTTIKMKATNDIIHGPQVDVASNADAPTGTSSVTLSHCDFKTHSTNAPTGNASINFDPSTTVTAKPKFENAQTYDYREKSGSPTIDKGATFLTDTTDIINRPRTVGISTDIGAYEFLQRPAIHHVKIRGISHDSATLSASVNAEGLVTQVRLVATHGHSTLQSAWVSGKNKRIARHLRLTVHGLSGGTKYTVRVVAKNDGGTAKSGPKTVTTH